MKKLLRAIAAIVAIALVTSAAPLAVFAADGAASVKFNKSTDLKAEVGKAFKRSAVTTPEGLAVTYSSSDTAVAAVDKTGKVTCLAPGDTVITAKSGGAKASYKLTVTAKAESSAPPSTGDPLKDKINAMKLEPLVTDKWSKDYYKGINKIISGDMTNYQKMRAVYDDIVKNYDKQMNCVGYAIALQCAFEAVGFRTYHMRGLVKTAAGGWTEHSWVGVDIGSTLYYFDANLPGRYNAPDKYFAVTRKAATFYKDAYIEKLEINPEAEYAAVLDSGKIPDTSAKRIKLQSEAGYKDSGFFWW